jgi:hypothetical protein
MLKRFAKLPRSVLRENDGHRLFELVATHIREQVERPAFTVNLKRLQSASAEAQTIYWLWLFQCEAGGGGIDAFVLNSLGSYTPQICDALDAVGADELVRRLKAAIPLARGRGAAFEQLSDQSWFDDLKPVAEVPTLSSLNEGVYPIVARLTDAAAAFIASNADAIFDR